MYVQVYGVRMLYKSPSKRRYVIGSHRSVPVPGYHIMGSCTEYGVIRCSLRLRLDEVGTPHEYILRIHIVLPPYGVCAASKLPRTRQERWAAAICYRSWHLPNVSPGHQSKKTPRQVLPQSLAVWTIVPSTCYLHGSWR